MHIRSILTQITQTHREANATVDPPTVIAVATLACANPGAGCGKLNDLGVLEQLGTDSVARLITGALAALSAGEFSQSDSDSDGAFSRRLWFESQEDFIAANATEIGKSVAADSMAHLSSRVRMFTEEVSVFG